MLARPMVNGLPMGLVEVHASYESFVTWTTSCALVTKLKTAHAFTINTHLFSKTGI